MPIGNALAVIRNFRPFPPVITSDGEITGTYNQSGFSYFITATNNPISYNATNLPTGLGINTITGQITGTPTVVNVAGTRVTISATNKSGTGQKTLIVKVLPLLPVITSSLSTIRLIRNISNNSIYRITATHMTPPELPSGYSIENLPNGLTLNTITGLLYGTPTILSSYNVTIGATNARGLGTANLTIAVDPPAPVLNNDSFIIGVEDTFNYTILGTNNPTSYNVGSLPSWLSFNNINNISGVAPTSITSVSSFMIPISATNVTGTGIGSCAIKVIPYPVITSSLTAYGNEGNTFSYQIVATNMIAQTTPFTYGATNLPLGLNISTSTGSINGLPVSAGTTNVTINATNAKKSDSKILTIIIIPKSPIISSNNLIQTTPNTPIEYIITAINNPTSYTVSNTPSWLTFDGNNKLTGTTPAATGKSKDFLVNLSASNAGGTGTSILTIRSTEPPVITNLPGAAAGNIKTVITFQITADNDDAIDGIITWRYTTGTAPAGITQVSSNGNTYWSGMTVNTSNTPGRVDLYTDVSGTYTLNVTCSNRAGTSISKVLSFYV